MPLSDRILRRTCPEARSLLCSRPLERLQERVILRPNLGYRESPEKLPQRPQPSLALLPVHLASLASSVVLRLSACCAPAALDLSAVLPQELTSIRRFVACLPNHECAARNQ